MVILNVRKEARSPIYASRSLTVGELIGFLSELDEDQEVCVGSAFLSEAEGWYWYASIVEADFKSVEYNEAGDVVLIEDAW